MRSIEKLWTVVYAIDQASYITPAGKPCRLPESNITAGGKIHDQDADYIIEKLEKDEKVIRIISQPDRTEFPYKIILNDPDEHNFVLEILPSFRDYKNRTYAKYTFGLESLNRLNLLKLIDVAMDIREKLQLTNESNVTIKALPPVVKFVELMPADATNLRDRYMGYRIEATECLQKLGGIINIDKNIEFNRWDSTLEVEVDRLEFDQLFEKLTERTRELKDTKQNDKKVEEKIKYDIANHTLIIGKVDITFNKDDSNQAELCRVLLTDSESANKNWNTEEMLEAWGWLQDRIYDKNSKLLKENRLKVYSAADKLNTKIMKASEGKISDFLIYSTKSVSLNSKYREMLANK